MQSRDVTKFTVAMMHAARRACAGVLKATQHSLTSSAVPASAIKVLPAYFNTRKITHSTLQTHISDCNPGPNEAGCRNLHRFSPLVKVILKLKQSLVYFVSNKLTWRFDITK